MYGRERQPYTFLTYNKETLFNQIIYKTIVPYSEREGGCVGSVRMVSAQNIPSMSTSILYALVAYIYIKLTIFVYGESIV